MAVPDYQGACVSNIVPALLEHRMLGEGWIPERVLDAHQVVLLVIDGLGWNQLVSRQHLAPVLAASQGQPITTVAPTTTAAALTSITTGAPPGDHGVVGYRIRTGGETLNVSGVTRGINYGSDKVRFTNMVPVGSKVRLRQKCTSVTEKSGGKQMIMENTIEIDGQERPALVAESITVLYG